VGRRLHGFGRRRAERKQEKGPEKPYLLQPSPWATRLSLALFVLLLAVLAYGAWRLVELLRGLSLTVWGETFAAAGWTLGRVLVATALGTLWAVPAGLAIGLSPRLSRILQPVVQVAASFPSPMLFPLVIALLTWANVSLGWGSILLMLLGTQWYILFNVVAGAMTVPADLREMARSYRITGWQRFWTLYVPAIFPYLVTGWVTAAGGAWNASIVSEYVTVNQDEVLQAFGLGAQISASIAPELPDYSLLAASTLVMSAVVVIFNRTVWRRCYRLAEERFSLNK
jgi:NitT/TauT family transport system permease protein